MSLKTITTKEVSGSMSRKTRIILTGLFICIIIVLLNLICSDYLIHDHEFLTSDSYNESSYLVQNPKCRIPSKNPMDPSILKYVQKNKFKECSFKPRLTSIVKEIDGNFTLVIDSEIAKEYDPFDCCWSSILRVEPMKPLTKPHDTQINISKCIDFIDKIKVPDATELIMVKCRSKILNREIVVYENIHAIINPNKFKNRKITNRSKKTSVLILGIDSISKMNFLRSLPQTEKYLREKGWINLAGYNKVGQNTYPNMMAMLTGSETSSSADCDPKRAFGLNNCPFLWHNFQRAGYITAFGEDFAGINTFTIDKKEFVIPSTDYYLLPYILAAEQNLRVSNEYGAPYCTGPELSFDRIFNFAKDFAVTFLDRPYFGFFWSNAVTHDDVNGLSSLDSHLLDYLQFLEEQSVFKNTLVFFMSDHGFRWGDILSTQVGWLEQRLPFAYLRVPESIKNFYISKSLRINEHRLVSPYDFYETLRDILSHAGGTSSPSSGCPTCQSLFKPVPNVRGCKEAGVPPLWCSCVSFEPQSPTSAVAQKCAEIFLLKIENIAQGLRNKDGLRLCAMFELEKIHKFERVIYPEDNLETSEVDYVSIIELIPGGYKFETLVRLNVQNESKFDVFINRISRHIDPYCVSLEFKDYCNCINYD